jgi:photosystem II stability/assembly factor-like uncharacterized protein
MAATPDYPQNNMVANRFIRSRDGVIYLVRDNTLFRMSRDEGDIWEPVVEDVKTVSIDPQNAKIFYAVTTKNSVIKSLDGGQRWIEINNGLRRAILINHLFIDPVDTQDVFAATELGLYRTRDAGFSWQLTALETAVTQFYINPTSPTHFYALTGMGVLMMSSDAGQTWQKSETGLPTEIVRRPGRAAAKVVIKATRLFFVGHGNTYLLAVTAANGVFKSDNHGASWRQTNLPIALDFSTAYIEDGEVTIAGSDIVRSTDGINWTRVVVNTIRLKFGYCEAITRHPRRDGLLTLFRYVQEAPPINHIGYVGKGGALITLSVGLLPRSDVTAIWTGSSGGRRTMFATVSNLTLDPHHRNNSSYLLGQGYYTPETATYFSIDDGYSWEHMVVPQCGLKVAMRPGDSTDMWMFGGVPGLASADPIYYGVSQYQPCLLKASSAGLNWFKAVGPRFAAANDSVSKIVFDPIDKGLLYYCAGVNEHRLYRYKYNPNSNEGQAVDLNTEAADIVVCESNPKMLYAGVGQLSTDGGWTWNDKSEALGKYIDLSWAKGYRREDFTLLSFQGKEIRIALHRYDTYMHAGGFGIIKSTDLGDRWEVVKSFDGQELTRIFVNPDDSKNMFVAVRRFVKDQYSSKGDTVNLLETKDGGAIWSELYSYKLTASDEHQEREIIRCVTQFSSNSGRSILLGGRLGLLRTNDEGKSWVRLGGAR